MAEIFVGIIEDFFYLESIGCLIAFRIEEKAIVKVGDKIKLITPENEVVETFIRGIPMINRRYDKDKAPDLNLISIQIENNERNKKGFLKKTKIYLIGENYE